MTESEKRSQAWIGDAVLALYARRWILDQPDIPPKERAAVFTRMTSNRFLSALGEPTAMEAEIGAIYEREGIESAFRHIESALLPLFARQRSKAKQPGNFRRK